ncbi:MAG: hypothetical protein GX624_01970 [Actinobacteria bacterium]|nr:hypothetical protein [Actinomycetota bacterium]
MLMIKAAGLARRGASGFSLLEAVISAGLVLATVTAVSLSVGAAARASARLERTMEADRAVRSVAECLRSLPFCAPVLPSAAGDQPADLVAAVFPHAVAWKNTAAARYAGAGADPADEPGSFISVWDEAGTEVRCTAWFLCGPDGPRLLPDDVTGWDAEGSAAIPGPALEVVVSAVAPAGARSVRLVLSALPPAIAPESAP